VDSCCSRGHTPYCLPINEAHPEDLRKLGFSNRKAQNILVISGVAVGGKLDDDVFESLDDSSVAVRLQELPGVGRWTAQYTSLRGLDDSTYFLLTTSVDKTSSRVG